MTEHRSIADVVDRVRSGVAHLVLEKDRERVGSGSGFLIERGLVTADHVLFTNPYDTLRIRFSDDGPQDGIRLDATTVDASLGFRSPEQELDLAVLQLDEPEVENRYRFALGVESPPIGTQVVVFGYPYDSHTLTSHVGYISAAYSEGQADVLQLDASVNPSNSGGPVIDPRTLEVVAYVTRAQTGLAKDFDQLIAALDSNISQLSGRGGIVIGGIDPRRAFQATMVGLRELAVNMKRSANVGIGYAFSAKHVRDVI